MILKYKTFVLLIVMAPYSYTQTNDSSDPIGRFISDRSRMAQMKGKVVDPSIRYVHKRQKETDLVKESYGAMKDAEAHAKRDGHDYHTTMEGRDNAGRAPCRFWARSGPSFSASSLPNGRGRENRFTNSPAICSQSAALPPFPQSRT